MCNCSCFNAKRLLHSVALLFVILKFTTVCGQDIRPLVLCDNRTETAKSSGIIKHIKSTGSSGTSCTLVLEGFDINSHLSLLGVEKTTSCEGNAPLLVINGDSYCVKSVYNLTIIKLTDTKLTINLFDSTASTFSLKYYSEIAVCGEDISIAKGAQVDGLTGIIASSYNPANLISVSDECTTTVKNLPSGAVRLEFLDQHLEHGSVTVRYLDKFNKLPVIIMDEIGLSIPILVTTRGRQISVTYVPDPEKLTEYTLASFVIRYTVPHCAFPPDKVANGRYEKIDTHTVTYRCNTGYRSEDRRTNATSVCSSSDPVTTPWTWNFTDVRLVCSSVECEIPDVANGMVLSGGETGRHYYPDTLAYTCFWGYKKSVTEEITCESGGLWSDPILCTGVECETPEVTDGMVLSGGETGRHYYLDTLEYDCSLGYRKSVEEKIICDRTGQWSDTVSCTENYCEAPDDVPDGRVLSGGETGRHYYSDTLDYECSSGYRKSVKGEITCMNDGLWSDIISCTWVECETPDITHGTVLSGTETGRHYYLDTLVYECTPGFRKSVEEITCEIDGLWSDDVSCTAGILVALIVSIVAAFMILMLLLGIITRRKWKVLERIIPMQMIGFQPKPNYLEYNKASADLSNPEISAGDRSPQENMAQDSGPREVLNQDDAEQDYYEYEYEYES